MTFEVPAHTQPGTILMPDGKILWRDHEWHAFGNFTVSYEQAQWSCPSMRWKFGVELERPSVRRPEVELL
jgi:hypothetical protein